MEVGFQGQWGGNSWAGEIGLGGLEGGGSFGWEKKILEAHEFPPQWPGIPLPLASPI